MYKALYYWMFKCVSNVKTNNHPAFNSFLLIVLFEIINLTAIGKCIYNSTHFQISKNATYVYAAIIFLVLMGFNFVYLFLRKSQIFQEVEAYNSDKLRLSYFIFLIYILASIIFIVLVVIFSPAPNLKYASKVLSTNLNRFLG